MGSERTTRRCFVVALAAAWCVALISGCVRERPDNPAFPLTIEDARSELEAMGEAPAHVVRPVLVLGGWGDPGIAVGNLERELRAVVADPESVSARDFFFASTIPAAREWAIAHALDAFAGGDEEALYAMQFDIVGFSMGGLVARAVAAPPTNADGRPALDVQRIFTISTPHKGAKAAVLPSFDPKIRAMRAGSPFLDRLDAKLERAAYELVCYVRLSDGIVGPENAAPDGFALHWVPNEAYEFSHFNAASDERILADIARRLRNERPYVDERGTPLPTEAPEADGGARACR